MNNRWSTEFHTVDFDLIGLQIVVNYREDCVNCAPHQLLAVVSSRSALGLSRFSTNSNVVEQRKWSSLASLFPIQWVRRESNAKGRFDRAIVKAITPSGQVPW